MSAAAGKPGTEPTLADSVEVCGQRLAYTVTGRAMAECQNRVKWTVIPADGAPFRLCGIHARYFRQFAAYKVEPQEKP